MSKGQYGVSVRHNPRIHKHLATIASWYEVELQRAFDILVSDRVEVLKQRFLKDLDKDPRSDEAPISFENLVQELFKIEIPADLKRRSPQSKPRGRKPGALTKDTDE